MKDNLLLDSLQVKGFRAFEDLQIPKLGRVNLITGKNNVGKTCLLEALQVYARRGEPNVLQSLLVRRDETYHSGNMKPEERAKFLADVRHIFYNRPSDEAKWEFVIGELGTPNNKIEVRLEKGTFAEEEGLPIDVLLRLMQESRTLNSGNDSSSWTGEMTSAHWKRILSEHIQQRRLIVIEVGGNRFEFPFELETFRSRSHTDLLEGAPNHTFVWTRGLDNVTLSRWWDSIALTNQEADVIRALQTIKSGILRVNFVSRREGNSERIPIVQVESRTYPIPMKSLGEGINRMFGLALALVSSSNGMLMVDEIETGFHYSVLLDMWRLVFQTARDLNVQVFATTHSKDCIDAFEQAAREDEETEGVLIRLQEKAGKISAVSFDERRLEIATREDIEVR